MQTQNFYLIEDWQKKIKQRIGPKRRFAFKIARFISIAWPGKLVAFVVHFGPKSTNVDETTARHSTTLDTHASHHTNKQ